VGESPQQIRVTISRAEHRQLAAAGRRRDPAAATVTVTGRAPGRATSGPGRGPGQPAFPFPLSHFPCPGRGAVMDRAFKFPSHVRPAPRCQSRWRRRRGGPGRPNLPLSESPSPAPGAHVTTSSRRLTQADSETQERSFRVRVSGPLAPVLSHLSHVVFTDYSHGHGGLRVFGRGRVQVALAALVTVGVQVQA
jgi:hypothetical protein